MRGLICLNARETAAVNCKQTFTNFQGEKDIKKESWLGVKASGKPTS